MNDRIAPGGPGDLALARSVMHDPRNQEWAVEEIAARRTEGTVAMVAAHQAELESRVPRRGRHEWITTDQTDAGAKLHHRAKRLMVVWSIALEGDGRPWLHVSCSHANRQPLHAEMALVKDLFVGDRYAYSVWPPVDRYVNLHPNVLHLWAPWWPEGDGLPLPEFSHLTPSGTRTI